jgi:hypothetical protein
MRAGPLIAHFDIEQVAQQAATIVERGVPVTRRAQLETGCVNLLAPVRARAGNHNDLVISVRSSISEAIAKFFMRQRTPHERPALGVQAH